MMQHLTTERPLTLQQEEQARIRTILRWLIIAGCGVVLLLLVMLLLLYANDVSAVMMQIVQMAGLLAVMGLAWVLMWAGRLNLAIHTFFLSLVATALITSLPLGGESIATGVNSPTLYSLYIPIVGATLLLRPAWSFVYAGLALLTYLLAFLLDPSASPRLSTVIFRLVLFCSYSSFVALLSYLAARHLERRLALALDHAQALERSQAELEQRVEERTRAAEQALSDLRLSSETIRQMSVPVVPVADGVLALPLVGSIDSQRAALLTDRLLADVQLRRAHTVLIDITGVPVVDTHVAGVLIQTAQAVRLLGAEPVLVGIRAEVAQVLVGLGIDFSGMITQRDLQSGLLYAQERNRLEGR